MKLLPARAPLLLLLLALALLLVGAAAARPGMDLRADDTGAARVLARFYELERNEGGAFRWSASEAAVFLYGFEGRPALVSLRLAGPRQPGAPGALVALSSAGLELGQLQTSDAWRRYHLLAPTRPAGETALRLRAEPYQAPGDPRELGVALSAVTTAPIALGGLHLQPVRALYLLALPLLGWLLLLRLGAPARAALGLGALLAGLAGLAAAFPTIAGYWLPTLGWPWWPALPLLLLALAPHLATGQARARGWVVARPWAGWAGLALALAALGLIRLGLPPAPGLSALLAGVWAGLTLLGDRKTDRAPAGAIRSLQPLGASPLVGVALILALALGLRLIDLGGQPAGLWRDEARHGMQALQIWEDPSYRPIYVVGGADLPALLFYLMAPAVGLLGPELWSARLVSALAGALTPLALAWAGTPLVGRRAALAAAALLAWASWGLSMSRWAFPATLDHLLVLTAVGLVGRCLPAPSPNAESSRVNGRWYNVGMALAGLLGGLAVYTYHTGRAAPLALAAVVALRLGPAPGAWRRALPGLGVALLAGALTLMPLALYLLGDLEGYNRRVGSVSLLDSLSLETRTPAGLLLGNLGRYALAYHVAGDANGRHHMPAAPLLDPVTGLLLALGLGLTLAQGRRRPGLVGALALGAIYLIPGVLSTDAPHAMRALGTLAPACLLAGAGLVALTTRARAWGPGLAAALLVASLSFNGWLYFAVMRHEPGVYREFDPAATSMGLAARAPWRADDPEMRSVRVYLPQLARLSDPVRYLGWGTPPAAIYSGAPLPDAGPALIVLPATVGPAEQAAALAALGPAGVALGPTAFYPGGVEPITLAFGRGAAAARLVATLREGQGE